MKRIILAALACLCILAATAQAQQKPNFYIEKPPTWSDHKENLGDELEAQFFSPGDDGLIEVYAGPTDPLDLDQFADQWVSFAVEEGGLPLQRMLTNAKSQTNTGVPGLVREYTGVLDGTNYHAFLIFSHYDGFMYVVMGLYTEDSSDVNYPAIYASLDSFGFPDSLPPQQGGQQGGQQMNPQMNQPQNNLPPTMPAPAMPSAPSKPKRVGNNG